ncbi:response regulator transcription factor [Flavobacteriaceae bacterium]|jgi:two-component system, NarL family, nitrate/nitrite response regulator NarL|nr:response regulator transcription factor [Flavobacteriaceae bacterium]
MRNNISLFIADDHPLLLRGLIDQLKEYGYHTLGAADNGATALDQIVKLQPDIAILDEEMPLLTGFEVIKKCKEKNIKTRFIILTSHKEKAFIYKAKKLNIFGYIIKDEPFIEIHKCIQSVSKGVPYFSDFFSSVFKNEVSPELQKLKLLSPSERTIVKLIAQNKSTKEIGELLFVSSRTIEKHRSNIISKLDLGYQKKSLSTWANENKHLIA